MSRLMRLEKIWEKLNQKELWEVDEISDLADELNIASSTMRRDLIALERESRIVRMYGGVRVNNYNYIKTTGEEMVINNRLNVDLKMRIAQKANSLVHENGIIFVGPGSTCEQFVKHLRKKIKILMTTSLDVINMAVKNTNVKKIYIIGGAYDSSSRSCLNSDAIEAISRLHFDQSFFALDHVAANGNMYSDISEDAKICSTLIANSNESIVLSDHSKNDTYGLFLIGNLSMVKYMVVDNQISKKSFEELLKMTQIIKSD